MKTLSNYLKYSETPIYESLSDIQDYSVFLNVFNKIDIYNKHTKLIAEGCTKYSNNIPYTLHEQCILGHILENYINNTILEYINESNLLNEGFSLSQAKELITSGKEKIKSLIQKFKDSIPEEVLEAYEFLIKALKTV